jgi:hypothetical protein
MRQQCTLKKNMRVTTLSGRSHSYRVQAETWRLFHMSVSLSQLTRRLGQKRKEATRLFMQIITNFPFKLLDEFRLRQRVDVLGVES